MKNKTLDSFTKKSKNVSPKHNIGLKNVKNKIFDALAGILIPCVPIMTLSGIIQGLYSIFTQTGVLKGISIGMSNGTWTTIVSQDPVSGIFYIIGQMGIGFCGVFFCYTTVKYLNGNGVMGILVGLTLATPMLYPGLQWDLFKIGELSIGIKAYTSSILCQVAAGFLYFYLDKWLSKIVPQSLELVFRHPITYVVSVLPMFLLFGPFLGIIEAGIAYGLQWVGDIPYGFGMLLFVFLFNYAILLGMGLAVFTLMIPVINASTETGTLLYVGITIPSLAQAGAAIAIGIRSKNQLTKTIAYSLIMPGLLNSTEPVVYGITFPKGRPFHLAAIASGIVGFMIYWLDVRVYSLCGGGIFANWLSFIKGGVWNVIWYFVVQFAAIGLGFGLTYPFYKERLSEKELTKKTNNNLIKYIKISQHLKKQEIKTLYGKDLDLLISFFSKETLALISRYDKELAEKVKIESKLKKESEKTKNQNEQLIAQYQTKLNEISNKLKISENEYQIIKNNYLSNVNKFLTILSTKYEDQNILNITQDYENDINGIYFEYKLLDKKDFKFNFSKK